MRCPLASRSLRGVGAGPGRRARAPLYPNPNPRPAARATHAGVASRRRAACFRPAHLVSSTGPRAVGPGRMPPRTRAPGPPTVGHARSAGPRATRHPPRGTRATAHRARTACVTGSRRSSRRTRVAAREPRTCEDPARVVVPVAASIRVVVIIFDNEYDHAAITDDAPGRRTGALPGRVAWGAWSRVLHAVTTG